MFVMSVDVLPELQPWGSYVLMFSMYVDILTELQPWGAHVLMFAMSFVH